MLQMVRHIMTIAITAATACACNQLDLKGLFMPTGDGVESRFAQNTEMLEDLNAGAVETDGDYIFYVAADPHVNQTHRNLDMFNDAMRNDSEAAFGVILGDCTDVRDNLPAYLEALRYSPDRHSYNHKLFHVLGNHDLFFKGWQDFKECVGPSTFWFEVVFPEGKDLYITLDTATGSLGRKQTEWLKSFLGNNRERYRHCILLTHTNFFYTDKTQGSSGNMPVEESFALIDLLGRNNVTLVLQGHDHFREDLTYDDVRYTVLGTIRDEIQSPEYLKIAVNQNGIELDWQLIS